MPMQLIMSALLVRDYDEAIDWYTRVLGFRLLEDEARGPGKRWVVVEAASGGRLLLARAATAVQAAQIGNQCGGRVYLFLHTEDFDAERQRLEAAGVVFEEATRNEDFGRVAIFRDLYGNRWDLIQPLDH
jgi:catechol 2,3-dioxygenase-like lactoylglutathione lyase family enzyme